MRSIAALLILCLAVDSFAAVRGEHAEYVGGTASIQRGEQGFLDASDQKVLRFERKGGAFSLPYSQIDSMEFGQEVGRRVGLTVAMAATVLGLAALPILFSKKKKHYLSIAFTEADGRPGAAVFQLAKDTVKPLIITLESRTGKKVEDTGDPKGGGVIVRAQMDRERRPAVSAKQAPIEPPALPEQFGLSISSVPPGAAVYADGKQLGSTPLTIQLERGQHMIGIQKQGFKTWGRSLDVSQAGEVSAELQPEVQESPSVIKIVR